MKATFEHSVDVLVKAYLNGTLLHGYCSACAVGNLCANAMGYQMQPTKHAFEWISNFGGRRFPLWDEVFISTAPNHQERHTSQYYGEAKKQIDSTGYTWDQLADIEKSFESANDYEGTDTAMFNGLMAVLDVLAEIHGVDLTVKQNAIGRFEEIHATK